MGQDAHVGDANMRREQVGPARLGSARLFVRPPIDPGFGRGKAQQAEVTSIIPPVAVSRARKPIWVDHSGGDKLPVSQSFARGVTLRLIDAPDKTARTALRRPPVKPVGNYTGVGSARHRPASGTAPGSERGGTHG